MYSSCSMVGQECVKALQIRVWPFHSSFVHSAGEPCSTTASKRDFFIARGWRFTDRASTTQCSARTEQAEQVYAEVDERAGDGQEHEDRFQPFGIRPWTYLIPTLEEVAENDTWPSKVR